MRSSNQSILQHLAEESAPDLQKQITSEFKTHQVNVKTLNNEYKQLEVEQEKVYKQLQNIGRYIGRQGKKNTVQSALWNVNKRAKQRNQSAVIAKSYLTKLQKWGVKGYKEVVSFREFITRGQKLEYDVVTKSHKMFHIAEDDYLQLLNNGKVVTRKQDWETLNPSDLNKVLSITVGNPESTFNALAKQAGKLKDKIAAAEYADKARRFTNISPKDKRGGVRADALSAFLYEHFGDTMSEARLMELYSQVRYSLFPSVAADESIEEKHFYFYTQPGINYYDKVLDFGNKYIDAKLHEDTDAFYQTGDAIKDSETLIENKFGNMASVSINTIRNALKSIDETINKETLDKNQLINSLVQLYTAKGGNEFAESIHGAARERAIEGIKETINTMFTGADVQVNIS